jgi:ABC-2 type transport system permease protein
MRCRLYWVAFTTLFRKEVKRFLRIWVQTLAPSVLNMSLYFLIFGTLMGDRIQDGVPYIQYIVPGLIMQAVVLNAYGNVASSLFSTRFFKSIEEMLVAPMSHFILLMGFVTAGMLRGIIVAALATAVALTFTPLSVYNPALLVVVLLGTALFFSLAGFTNSLFSKSFDDVSLVPTFLISPLTYLGGIFNPVSMLPPVWQKIALFNPLLYIVNGFRYAMLGISDVPITYTLFMLGFGCLFLLGMNLYFLQHGKGIRS